MDGLRVNWESLDCQGPLLLGPGRTLARESVCGNGAGPWPALAAVAASVPSLHQGRGETLQPGRMDVPDPPGADRPARASSVACDRAHHGGLADQHELRVPGAPRAGTRIAAGRAECCRPPAHACWTTTGASSSPAARDAPRIPPEECARSRNGRAVRPRAESRTPGCPATCTELGRDRSGHVKPFTVGHYRSPVGCQFTPWFGRATSTSQSTTVKGTVCRPPGRAPAGAATMSRIVSEAIIVFVSTVANRGTE